MLNDVTAYCGDTEAMLGRNNDNAILKNLLRYDLDEDDEFLDIEEAYDEQYQERPQSYPKGRVVVEE